MASGGSDGIVKLWDVTNSRRGNVFALDSQGHLSDLEGITSDKPVLSLEFDFTGQLLAASSIGGNIQVFSVATGRKVAHFRGHQLFDSFEEVRDIAFSKDSQYLYSAGGDGAVHAWNLNDGQLEYVLRSPDTNVAIIAIQLSPDNKLLWLARESGIIEEWSIPDRAINRTITLKQDDIDRFAFSFSGDLFAMDAGMVPLEYRGMPIIGWGDYRIFIGKLESGDMTPASAHSDTIYALDFSSDGMLLASGSSDRSVCVWKTADFHK